MSDVIADLSDIVADISDLSHKQDSDMDVVSDTLDDIYNRVNQETHEYHSDNTGCGGGSTGSGTDLDDDC